MATAKAVSYRSQEKHTSQTSQSFKTSTSTTKRKFKSSDEDFASIPPPKLITADVSSSHISSQKQSSSSESSDTVRKKTSRAWKKEVGKTTLFGNDLQKLEEGLSRATNYMLMTTDRKALHQIAEERAQEAKDFIELCSARPASFDIPLRPHTVWERMAVKLACVVQGSPLPDAKWYKDGIQIRPSITPGKYRIQNKYGLHSLEIARCDLDDSGEYSITISNAYGEATSYANVLVNSYEGTYAGADEEKFPTAMLETEADFAKVFLPSFPQELESYFLSCTFSSPLPKYQQNVQWFRNGMPLKESKWLQMEQTQQSAFLIFPSVHKEDEGLYTIRIPTLTGYKEHSAYVFVRDAEVSTAGVPGSPLDVKCHDVNKDYLFLSWSPPSTDGETNIIGYYVERCEAGTNQWLMCNDRPVKECKFPVGHLTPGHAYQFRVRAVNQRGMSHPSKVTKPVTMVDPKEADRTMVIPLDDMKTITVTKDELEAEVTVPLPPTNVHTAEKKDSYVVLCWDEPVPRGREPLTYLIEKSLHGSKSWQLANMDIPVHSPRFVVSDLAEGKQYSFRVRAENKHGISEPSLPSEPISLGKISAPLPPPKKVVAYRDTKTSAVVRWDKLKDADDCLGYYVYCCECGTNDWKTVNNKPVTSDSLTVPGLTTGKKYIFHVKSVSPAGLSKPSQDSEPIIVNAAIAPPSAPYCFVLLYCGKNEMIVGWRAPQFRGGAAILGYFLDKLNVSEGEWHSFNDNPLPKTVCKVGNLKEGQFYRFRACAVNLAGVGKMSSPSDEFICEEWTMAQPGPPFDVRYTEVRSTSLMLHWDPPFYTGKSAVTGYFVEVCEMGKEEWNPVNKNAVSGTHLKIPNLETGKGYSFRARAVNSAGVGEPSAPSDPVLAETRPGTKEIEVDVDEDGFIFFSFETPDLSDSSEFIWSKDYEDLADSDRVKMESDGNRSKLILTNPSEQDLGTYSVEVTETDGISSSHTLTPEELEKLLARSHEIRNPLIKLISGWNIDILEKGEVRLWLQVEPLSPNAQIKLIFNETPMSSTPTRQIKYDKPKGLVEIIITDFSRKDEGSYTAQIQDGKPKNQFTLVLIDDKFKDVLDRSDFQRKEWKRKQGPHFLEYLKWTVTEECEILFTCKITNTRKDTQFKWFKDGKELKDGQCDFQTGACSLLLKEFTKNTEGVYKATVSDARGEDVSELNLTGKGLEDLIREICRVSALTAGPLKILSTAEGIKLYSVLKCYVDDLKTTWFHKEKKLDSSQRIKIGSSPTQVWMHIGNPTEADKGKYTLELFDGKEKHKRTLDLSGQAFADAMAEYQRLKQAAFAEKNRARIEQGLPDVATIMEDKTLILTCSVSGDPAPEVSWLKNEKPLPVERCEVSIKGKIVTLTIKQVTGEDSGMYELLVKNKHGSESVKVTVSVYKHGEEPLEAHKLALGQSGKAR